MWDAIVEFFKSIWEWIFGGGGNDEPIRIMGKKLCMPLFYPMLNGHINGTWNYFALDDAERQRCRDKIKSMSKGGEVPALTALLTPNECTGGLWTTFPTINAAGLDRVKSICRETVEDGVAIGVTLYNDDPGPRDPKWWEITNTTYQAAWAMVWEQIKNFVSFVTLSIESNEKTTSVGMLQHAIHLMEQAMPGAQAYGTHMAINGRGLNGYCWNKGANTPANASIILVENSWTISNGDQGMGDRQGVAGAQRDWDALMNLAEASRCVMHEGNLHPESDICEAQRDFYRSRNAWGVGA
ncbi:MAG: hypothetical protein PHI63_06640 [Patescibacteria group bacterium]|nr:hypothetical protein [Patescibacteria group bacterium]